MSNVVEVPLLARRWVCKRFVDNNIKKMEVQKNKVIMENKVAIEQRDGHVLKVTRDVNEEGKGGRKDRSRSKSYCMISSCKKVDEHAV